MFLRFLSVLFLVLAFHTVDAVSSQVAAQQSDITSNEFGPIIDAAKEKGLSVIVVTPGEQQDKAEKAGPTLGATALKVRSELRRIVSRAPEMFSNIGATIERVSPQGNLNWLWFAIATAAGGVLLGMVPMRMIAKWGKQHFHYLYNPDSQSRAEKISYLMFRAFMILLNLAALVATAVLVSVIVDSGHDASRGTIGVIIVSYAVYRIFQSVIFFNLIAPDVPSHRMINLADDSAERIHQAGRLVILAVIAIIAVPMWLMLIGLTPDTLKLLVILALLLSALLIAGFFLRFKTEFAGIVLGSGDPLAKPTWRRVLASQWHLLVVGYLGVAWAVSAVRIVLNQASPLAILGAPIVAGIVGVAIYGLLLVLIDRTYNIRQRRFEERVTRAHEENRKRVEAEREALDKASENPPEDDDELVISKLMSSRELEEMPVFKPVFKPLLEQAAGILVTIVAVGYILGAWDVNLGEQGNPVTAFLDTLVVLFVGWFLYRAVIAYVDHQLEEEGEGAGAGEDEPSDDGMGQGSSRLATLLPLVRNTLVISIVILTVMIILSNMGVDIAPLFAGAGVIGLAVGFGAQTLIRDIFSGGFFLFDDAFRKGEYIELGNIRGTVEKISLRSFQLRHHNGPLHTVPFGEITQLTNYSRDWVMMKLPLRLTYDTDVERVRKLVKKLGQRLLEHPEVGHLFVQPLKSQGVYKMEDSAMIIRVKFMTKPGDQFVTRKVVYAEIRELFENEGIKFANKEVTVRLAEEPVQELSTGDKKMIAASAARSLADDEAEAPQGGGGEDR